MVLGGVRPAAAAACLLHMHMLYPHLVSPLVRRTNPGPAHHDARQRIPR